MNKAISRLLLTLAITAIGIAQAAAQSAGQTALVVHVTPEAYAEGPGAVAWNAGEGLQAVEIPLRVLLRLNRGATAELSISTASTGEASTGQMLQVQTPTGFVAISDSAVVVKQFAKSGGYDLAVVFRQASNAHASSPTAVRLLLSHSDDSAAWSRIIHIH
jgi:hypothetical protein